MSCGRAVVSSPSHCNIGDLHLSGSCLLLHLRKVSPFRNFLLFRNIKPQFFPKKFLLFLKGLFGKVLLAVWTRLVDIYPVGETLGMEGVLAELDPPQQLAVVDPIQANCAAGIVDFMTFFDFIFKSDDWHPFLDVVLVEGLPCLLLFGVIVVVVGV